MNCFLTGDVSKFSQYVDPSALPGLFGDEFTVSFSDASADMLFLIKKSTDFSVSEALLSESQFDADTREDDIKTLRDVCSNEARRAEGISDTLGNTSYKSLLSCIDDKSMTGILIFFPPATIKKKQCMGPAEITGSMEYVLPIIQISNVTFHGDKPDVSKAVSCGMFFLKEQPDVITDHYKTFSLSVKESFALFRQEKLYMPQLVFGIVFYRLFEQEILSEATLLFLGSYLETSDGTGDKSAVFDFRLIKGGVLDLTVKAMPRIMINDGSAEFESSNGDFKFKLNVNGVLVFAVNTTDYDYFSFDSLKFSNMKVDFSMSGKSVSMECHYRDIQLHENESQLRSDSFLHIVPHGELSLICFQDGKTPAELGFRQMNVGCVQQVIGEGNWFGLSIPVELFHGIKLRLLFAFESERFYAGAALGEKTSVTLSSLIDVRWEEMQVQKTSGKYALGFRGLKISCFGKAFPEGSANMLLVPHQEDGSMAWYALYDNRKGDVKNG